MHTETPTTTRPESARNRYLANLWEDAGMLIVYAVMFAVVSLTVPYFLSVQNLIGLSLSVSQVGMLACTMLFCLAAGDFDLSIGSVVAFAGCFNAVLMLIMPGHIVVPVLATLLVSLLIGLFNGFVIAKVGINALITTLATMQIVRGLGFIMSGGVAVGIANDAFYLLGNGTFLGVPVPIWVTLLSFLIFGFLLNRTVFGRNALAIGGNKEAARLSGIDVDRTKMVIFSLQGLMAGAAGVILSSRITSGQPNASQGFELDVISACVLGGVSLSGGLGTMVGTVVGVLIMGTVQNVLNLLNVPTFYQYVVRGTVLLLAVLFDQLKQRRAAA
ncbi:MAG TPA: L-arabinose ABC transporter permease AraH [Anaeromyxobacteraceae bacterium]|nr:L-arabinose ABC transporter permease AraH [Anaeromyxobacteraceae bacterium]